MIKLKPLGLLAFAALAMGAMFASAAQGQTTGVLTAGHTEHTSATLVGTQYPDPQGASEEEVQEWEEWNFFEGEKGSEGAGGIVECDTATLTGTTETGTESSLRVAADYAHCRAEGSQDAIVRMNGCEYTLDQAADSGAGEYTGGAGLECPILEEVHKQIEVDIYLSGNPTNTSQFFRLCTVTIGPAPESEEAGEHTIDPLTGEESHIAYKNVTSGGEEHHVTATVALESIYSDWTACGGGAEVHDDGTYTSTLTIEAFNDDEEPHNEQLDLWLSDETE